VGKQSARRLMEATMTRWRSANWVLPRASAASSVSVPTVCKEGETPFPWILIIEAYWRIWI
jgi:hypothetical protein